MVKRTFSAEQIIGKLRAAEVLSSHTVPVSYREGKTAEEVCRALAISDQTYYRWPP